MLLLPIPQTGHTRPGALAAEAGAIETDFSCQRSPTRHNEPMINKAQPSVPAPAQPESEAPPRNPFAYKPAPPPRPVSADQVEVRAVYVLGAQGQMARYYALGPILLEMPLGRGLMRFPPYYRLHPRSADYFTMFKAPTDLTSALSASLAGWIVEFEAEAARLTAKIQVALETSVDVEIGLRIIVSLKNRAHPFVSANLAIAHHRWHTRSWIEYEIKARGYLHRGEYTKWDPKDQDDRVELAHLEALRELLGSNDNDAGLRKLLKQICMDLSDPPQDS